MRIKHLFFVCTLILTAACDRNKEKADNTVTSHPKAVTVPQFNTDSAFTFVRRQVEFGPRIPNTPPHRATGDYLITTLKNYGALVTVQEFEGTTYDGQLLSLRNIIASYAPEKQKRILLAAHWDTRPFADKDKKDPNARFDGANDGASGVGVLLELARLFKSNTPPVGIDLIFFDGEDWGEKEHDKTPQALPEGLESWWCLGSQYWAKNKHKANYSAYYGILLDMVGAKNAQFHREGYSLEYAPSIVENVWNTAARLGYTHIFVKQNQSPIIDDHYFINKLAKIPTVDIVHFQPGVGFFGDFHHSKADNIDLISTETLRAVGETVLNVVYSEEGS